MRKHYHVTEYISGYLPDHEIETFTSLTDARNHAQWRADSWREINEPDYPVSVKGSKTRWYVIDRGGYTLPIYIDITPCDMPECIEEG
jgi:hypothetical protein